MDWKRRVQSPRYNEGPRDWQKFVRYNEVSLYRGSSCYILLLLGQRKSFVIPRTALFKGTFPYILQLLGQRKLFVIPRTSLYRSSFYRGSTVHIKTIEYPGVSGLLSLHQWKMPLHWTRVILFKCGNIWSARWKSSLKYNWSRCLCRSAVEFCI